jgi:hypothetical protein
MPSEKRVFFIMAAAGATGALALLAWLVFLGDADRSPDPAGEGVPKPPGRPYVLKQNDQSDLHPRQVPEVREAFLDGSVPELAGSVAVGRGGDLERLVREASDGQTIALEAGRYAANLDVRDKNVVLVGRGARTVLEPVDRERPVVSVAGGVLELRNLTLAGGVAGLSAEGARLSLEKVRFEGFSASALYVRECEVRADGLYVYRSGSGLKAVASKGSVRRSVFSENQGTALSFLGGEFVVTDSDIFSNGSYGLFADPDATVRLDANYIQANVGYDVRIESEAKIYR